MPIKLAVFDVDGTLLRGDTVCQLIARGIGKYERMCELEAVCSREQIIAAREEMAGWYLGFGQTEIEAMFTGLVWAPGAVEGVRMLQDAGVNVALASVTWSFAVQHIARRLKVTELTATGLDFDSGMIDHVWGSSKAEFLENLSGQFGFMKNEVAAVGDTSSDYDMLQRAGLGVFVGPSQPDLPGVMHLPCGDIRDVARAILEHEPE